MSEENPPNQGAKDNGAAEILARIDERLAAVGMNDRQASLAATGTAHAIRNIRRGSEPAPSVLRKLAPVLDTTAAYLAFGTGEAAPALIGHNRPPAEAAPSIRFVGQVAAGAWHEVDDQVDVPAFEDFPIPADPDYEVEWQFAAQVVGTSINKIAPDGAILGCVDTKAARYHPRNGDLVIVERTRYNGQERERTAKQFQDKGDTVELWPVSDDPKWTKPIIVPRGDFDDGTEITVIGFVTWLHMPVRQTSRRRRV